MTAVTLTLTPSASSTSLKPIEQTPLILKTAIQVQSNTEKMAQALKTYEKMILDLRGKVQQLEKTATCQEETISQKDEKIEELTQELNQLKQTLKTQETAQSFLNPVDLQELIQAQSIEALPPPSLAEIQLGYLEALLRPSNKELQQEVKTELSRLLQNSPKEALKIFHLALYLANFDRASITADPKLFKTLREWMIVHAAQDVSDTESTLRQTLLISLGSSTNRVPGSLLNPLLMLPYLSALVEGLKSADPLIYVRCLIAKENRNPAEQLFLDELYLKLDQMEEKVFQESGSLADPKNTEKPLCLKEQLIENPIKNAAVQGKRSNEQRKIWSVALAEREGKIREAIASLSEEGALRGLIIESSAKLPEVNLPHPSSTPSEPVIADIRSALQKGEVKGRHNYWLGKIETALQERLKKVTGLKISSTQFSQLLYAFLMTQNIPPLLLKVLGQDQGQELVILMQLLYYSAALSHLNPRFQEFASDEQWDWLLSQDKASRTLELLRAFSKDPNFKGSVMTARQVLWAENLYALMSIGKGQPIYAQAGSGKTTTATFTINLLKKLLSDCKEQTVHLISPFYNQVEGLSCHQMDPKAKRLVIEVTDDSHLSDAVIVDEAHLLDPEIEIILRSKKSGKEQIVEPLHMTATPIIPDLGYGLFKEELHQEFQSRLDDLRNELNLLEARLVLLKQKLIDEKKAELKKELLAQEKTIEKFQNYLPNARQAKSRTPSKLPSRFDAIKKESLSKQNLLSGLKELVIDMNYLLNPLSIGSFEASSTIGSIDGPESLRKIQNKLGNVLPKPLQTLDKKQFDAEVKVLAAFTKNLLLYRDLVAGKDVPLELKNEALGVSKELKNSRALEAELAEKTASWERKKQKETASRQDDAFVRALPQLREAAFEKMTYLSQPATLFSPQAAAQALILKESHSKLQLIFPGVTFTEENFKPLLLELQKSLTFLAKKKPIVFVYQDSHSKDGKLGKKWAITLSGESLAYQPLSEFSHKESDPFVVLLYDTTNKQGGDFNGLSDASKEDITQVIFYHLIDQKNSDPASQMSANDLYQALSRRRGVSKTPAIVIGSCQQKSEFLALANKKQKQLERSWAARDAAVRISKKILKLYLFNQGTKLESLRHKSPQVLQDQVSSLKGLDIPHLLRESILQMSENSQEIKVDEPLQPIVTAALTQRENQHWRLDKGQREIHHLIQKVVEL